MPTSAREPLLEIRGLAAGYGKISVLNGVDLTIGAGEVVALLGPNGAGKSTLLKAVSGLLPKTGSVRFAGQDLSKAGPREAVQDIDLAVAGREPADLEQRLTRRGRH